MIIDMEAADRKQIAHFIFKRGSLNVFRIIYFDLNALVVRWVRVKVVVAQILQQFHKIRGGAVHRGTLATLAEIGVAEEQCAHARLRGVSVKPRVEPTGSKIPAHHTFVVVVQPSTAKGGRVECRARQ